VASTRRESERYTASICSRTRTSASLLMVRLSPPGLMRVEHPDRPDLNRASPRRGNARGHLYGFVQVCCVDQVEASELFLGLCEGAVGGGNFALADPHCRGGLGGL